MATKAELKQKVAELEAAAKKADPAVTDLPEGFGTDEHGITTMDPLTVDSLEVIPSDHFSHYFSEKTGEKLQGGGVKTEFAYYIFPHDLPKPQLDAKLAEFRAEGWRVVQGVRCQDLHGTIVRRPRALQEQARKRRRHLNAIQSNEPTPFEQSEAAQALTNSTNERDGVSGGLTTKKATLSMNEALNQ